MPSPDSQHQDIIAPILTVGPSFRKWALALSAVVGWAVIAWVWQLTHGLGATGLGRPIYWGLYITNFVFFIGVSHAGTLISAILRIVGAEWRRPITRMAEVITVLVLFFGVGNVLLDLGGPIVPCMCCCTRTSARLFCGTCRASPCTSRRARSTCSYR